MRSTMGLGILFVLCNTVGNLVAALSNGTPFNPFKRSVVMWYLMALIIYRVAMPVFSRIPGLLLVAGSFLLSWNPAFFRSDSLPPIVGRMFAFLPFFVLGHIVSRERRISTIKRWITSEWGGSGYAFILAAILIAGAWFALAGIQPGLLTRNVTFATFGGGIRTVLQNLFFQAIYIVMGICFLKVCPIRETCLSKFGARTLPVYLFHPYILVPTAALVSRYSMLSPWQIKYSMMGLAAIISMFFFHPRIQLFISRIVSLDIWHGRSVHK